MQDQITVKPEAQPQPDLRKLARALIALARGQVPERRKPTRTGADKPQGDSS